MSGIMLRGITRGTRPIRRVLSYRPIQTYSAQIGGNISQQGPKVAFSPRIPRLCATSFHNRAFTTRTTPVEDLYSYTGSRWLHQDDLQHNSRYI